MESDIDKTSSSSQEQIQPDAPVATTVAASAGKSTTSVLSIISLILALLSCFWTSPLIMVIAFICGLVAVIQIIQKKGQLTGMSMAIIGMILSGLTIYLILPGILDAGNRARAISFHQNEAIITKALDNFHADCGVYPVTLDDLYANCVDGSSASVSSSTKALNGWHPDNFNGPYLNESGSIISSSIQIPVNPYVDNAPVANQTIAAHWTYTRIPATSHSYDSYSLTGTVLPPAGY